MNRWLRPYPLAAALLFGSHIRSPELAQAQEGRLSVTTLANAQTNGALAAVAAGKRATALVDTPDSNGSAFCIDPSGIFVTNEHVVEGYARVKVIVYPGTPMQQTLIARVSHDDRVNDLAVLVAETAPNPRFPLTALRLGDSNELVETLPVAVFGFPFGLDLALGETEMPDVTVTTGRITSLRRLQGQLKEIQLDAAVNPGNSGGPVINEQGEVVGIVRAQIEFAQGLNFAIPVNVVRGLLTVPELRFGPPPVEWSKRWEVQNWTVDVVPFPAFGAEGPGQPGEYTVSLAVGAGQKWRDLTVLRVGGNAGGPVQFQATGALYPEGVSTPRAINYRLILQRNGRTIVTREGPVMMNGAPAPPPFQRPRDGRGPQESGPILQNPANGHWYQLVVPEEDLDWEGAKAAAAAMKHQGQTGYLATLTSTEESRFITTKVLENGRYAWIRAWIGGQQKPDSAEPSQDWTWITGEPWKSTNWGQGEPNNVGEEDHLQLDQMGYWNDGRGADFNSTYIVEFGPLDSVTAPEPAPAATAPTTAKPATTSPPVVATPPAANANTVIDLPAPATAAVVGGGGRYLLLHLKDEQKVAVFDTQEKKIARFIAAPGEKVLMAAGQQKLVLLLADQNILQRWDLQTGTREQSVPLEDDKAVTSMAMGSASAGPVMLIRAYKPWFFDLATLKPIPMLDGETGKPHDVNSVGIASASADGSTFGMTNFERNRQKVLMELDGNRIFNHVLIDVYEEMLPSFDGRWWFSSAGIFTGEAKPVVADHLRRNGTTGPHQFMTPALHPSYFLALKLQDSSIGFGRPREGSLDVSIYSANDRRLLANLGSFDELNYIPPPRPNQPQAFPVEKRIYFMPEQNRLVTISDSLDQLVIRPLNLTELLTRQGKKYLFVSSTPPRRAVKGSPFSYQLKVESKEGGIKYKVESGPEGLTVTPAGLVQWKVPTDFAEPEVTVLIAVSDQAGQELYHSFRVQVKGQ